MQNAGQEIPGLLSKGLVESKPGISHIERLEGRHVKK